MDKIFLPIIDNGGGLSRTGWAISMMGACLSSIGRRELDIRGISYPYPSGAMNIASNDFMASDCREMLIIDTDILFSPRHLEMLLEHDVPLVAGIYPKKEIGLIYPIVPLPGNPDPFKGTPGLHEVKCAARGFMRIQREVFDTLRPVTPLYRDQELGRNAREYWREQPGGHSEDFAFCNRYRDLGGKVYVDSRVTVQHLGNATYPIKGTF